MYPVAHGRGGDCGPRRHLRTQPRRVLLVLDELLLARLELQPQLVLLGDAQLACSAAQRGAAVADDATASGGLAWSRLVTAAATPRRRGALQCSRTALRRRGA
jgi:hypothetical protein